MTTRAGRRSSIADERLTMCLLRYRRAHRYGSQLDRLPPPPPPLPPPSLDDEDPNPDEALGNFDWHLDDLVDERELHSGLDQALRALDGADFANFGGIDDDETSVMLNWIQHPLLRRTVRVEKRTLKRVQSDAISAPPRLRANPFILRAFAPSRETHLPLEPAP